MCWKMKRFMEKENLFEYLDFVEIPVTASGKRYTAVEVVTTVVNE